VTTAIWRVGHVTDLQRKKNLELERQLKIARRQVEQAAENVNVGLRNMSLLLMDENEQVLKDVRDASSQSGRGRG
jgi:hypothetical protein